MLALSLIGLALCAPPSLARSPSRIGDPVLVLVLVLVLVQLP